MENQTPSYNFTVVAQPVIDLSSDDEGNFHQKIKLEPPPEHHQQVIDMEVEYPNNLSALAPPVVVLSSDVEDNGSRGPLHLYPNIMLEHGQHVIDMEVETPKNIAAVGPFVVVLSSDDEDDDSRMPFDQKVVLEPVGRLLKRSLMDGVESADHIWIDKDVDVGATEDMTGLELIDRHGHEILVQDCLASKDQIEELKSRPDKDVNIGLQTFWLRERAFEKHEFNYQSNSKDIEISECKLQVRRRYKTYIEEEDLTDAWHDDGQWQLECSKGWKDKKKEKKIVLTLCCLPASSRIFSVDPSADEPSGECGEECDHSSSLKDDLGLVCRICGIIHKGIETIFEFQYSQGKRSTRTYMSEPQDANSTEPAESLSIAIKSAGRDLTATDFFAHPMHRKHMKPHQVEGFNFLCRNLMADNPGGCILAHAPGSGKTFLIISFFQSYLARFPNARPLVVLPKGILATWKKEFQIWQVEDIPLHDLYTSKAENRSQQLDVLTQWVGQKSILFLGYQQFSTIMFDQGASKTSDKCREILLNAPSLLILDEGHTPRNDETNQFQSLARVHTPRK
ncbi:hypothetical protein M0R45_008274 [Rubus argutus]|uniref:Helicase ATP-binding domain-containing protein n=1 Tax=Rubus argutus TaxID=59490 RepID=A0AAW1Y0X7_RUBAR